MNGSQTSKKITTCLIGEKAFQKKLEQIRLIIFDWDGVFYNGYKNSNRESMFSEMDTMGINLLRFGFWLKNKSVPPVVIISGENNPTAEYLSKRDFFNAVFFKVKNKVDLLPQLQKTFGYKAQQMLFVFDDVLDISLAKEIGLRYFIPKSAMWLFAEEVKKNKWCDVVAGNDGGHHAIRELAEFTLHQLGIFSEVIQQRISYSKDYQSYLKQKKKIKPKLQNLEYEK